MRWEPRVRRPLRVLVCGPAAGLSALVEVPIGARMELSRRVGLTARLVLHCDVAMKGCKMGHSSETTAYHRVRGGSQVNLLPQT